jgi:hypothetical protein
MTTTTIIVRPSLGLVRSRGPWPVVLRSELEDKAKPKGRQENGVGVPAPCRDQSTAAAASMVTAMAKMAVNDRDDHGDQDGEATRHQGQAEGARTTSPGQGPRSQRDLAPCGTQRGAPADPPRPHCHPHPCTPQPPPLPGGAGVVPPRRERRGTGGELKVTPGSEARGGTTEDRPKAPLWPRLEATAGKTKKHP